MSKKKKKKQTDDIIIKTVNGIKVTIPEELEDWESVARRPYYQMRGKPVTPEQAFDIIRCLDTFFTWGCGIKKADIICDDQLHDINFNMWWFDRHHYPMNYGWCHPDGTIGDNGITQKYPNIEELIKECTMWIKEFPYLDIVIAITIADEETQWQREKHFETAEIRDKAKRNEAEKVWRLINPPDFFDCFDIVVWVHDGELEFMDGKAAINKYKEYAGKYESKNVGIYSSDYYKLTGEGLMTEDYLRRCLDVYCVPEERKEEIINKWNEDLKNRPIG